MEAPITLTNKDYADGLQNVINSFSGEKSYAAQFKVDLPEGMNTCSVMEICRLFENPDFESKVHIARLCLVKKNVVVTCPNGDVEKFYMSNVDDKLEAFPLFEKEPLALTAIADCVYGYILKKYVRPSTKAHEPAVAKTE